MVLLCIGMACFVTIGRGRDRMCQMLEDFRARSRPFFTPSARPGRRVHISVVSGNQAARFGDWLRIVWEGPLCELRQKPRLKVPNFGLLHGSKSFIFESVGPAKPEGAHFGRLRFREPSCQNLTPGSGRAPGFQNFGVVFVRNCQRFVPWPADKFRKVSVIELAHCLTLLARQGPRVQKLGLHRGSEWLAL